MTREQETLLEQFIKLAGEPGLVESVIKDLNRELGEPPTIRQVVRRILERQEQDAEPMAIR